MKGKIKTHVAIGDYSFIENEVDFEGTQEEFERTEFERLEIARVHHNYLKVIGEKTEVSGVKWEKRDGKWHYQTK